MRIFVEAYGCAMNRGEAHEFISGFLGAGHSQADTPGDADALAIFTCGVIEATERHMLKRLGKLSLCPERPLLVCGCLPKICPEKILEAAPHAILIGPARHLENLEGPDQPPVSPEPSTVGILPVATGCLGECAYCITRNARGALQSRPPEAVQKRLASLVNNGAAEIQLCSQDMGVYGVDLGLDLADLMEGLETVEGDIMMRIGMMNPASVHGKLDRILEAFDSPKVFKFLHLPVQSGSDAVLAGMKRCHTARDFAEIVREFRNRFPGMVLSTDIIVGFPGETHDDFLLSMELMSDAKPDIINVTRFSSRPGTEAHAMEPKIPGWKAKERSRAMTDLRFRLGGGNYRGAVGNRVRALATERRVPGTTFLRTREYRPVVVDTEMKLGRWYDIGITGVARTHLIGE